jgi:NADPH-dependent curcumin reductase CurA
MRIMTAQVSREIRLKARPTALPTMDNFELASVELKAPANGEVQVRNLWMSVDPYMRARMIDRPSYVPPFQLGQPLQGAAVGEVVASRYPAFKSGDIVRSMFGWRESFNAPAKAIEKIDLRGLPMQTFLGAAGGPGLAAYVGLLKVAELKDGDVVFVSAASGAVGSIVCQIAKIKGHTVIASTGGARQVRLSGRTRRRPHHRRRRISQPRSVMRRPRGSTSISTMSAALISRRRSRSPGRSPASRSAA